MHKSGLNLDNSTYRSTFGNTFRRTFQNTTGRFELSNENESDFGKKAG